MITDDDVQDIVREFLRKRFPKIRVARIDVQMGADDDDNKIIEITVVFEAKPGDFDPAELRVMPREIIDELQKVQEFGFPIISFIAKSELEGRRA